MTDDRFERAVDAVVAGDLTALQALPPGLARARSARQHQATLLHYVAANGVEEHRQRTPPNVVDVARVLLEAGAEVDAALADGESTTLGLVASSVHPERAGVQIALIDTLLKAGAAIDGLPGGWQPLGAAIANGRQEAAEALAERGARVDGIVSLAALGRADAVRRWLAAGAQPPAESFGYACLYGRTEVVDLLLRHGADPAGAVGDGQTGAHLAAHGGQLAVIELLIERAVPLEVRNGYGGTVLAQAVWSAVNEPRPDHLAVIEALINAGADRDAVPYDLPLDP